jgi:FKBP-type peptidyl-prolyl cis-trans isomerase FkpA
MIHSIRLYIKTAAALAAITGLAACGGDGGAETGDAAAVNASGVTTTALEDGSEFIVRVLASGDGEAIAAGQLASVHYTGWLHEPDAPNERGGKFDSSVDRGTPFQFPLGQGRVIRGWDVGVDGMQIGEKRELIIPAIWAYGDRGAGGVIPPGATLLFEVELLGIN